MPGAGAAVAAGGTAGGTTITEPGPKAGNGTPEKPVDVRPVSVFFNYGRYDILDSTNEGLGSGQNAKLATFVSDATRARASAIDVNGFASPEDNLSNAQLPLHRATAVKNRLDQLFAAGPVNSVRVALAPNTLVYQVCTSDHAGPPPGPGSATKKCT